MDKLPISACLVIHNEEKTLDRCLKSFADLVSEIIVVHDGPCSDRSLDIAKKYHAKIFVRPYKAYCEYHRPFTFKTAKHDWLLMPDADEYLSKELKKTLPRLVDQKRKTSVYDFLWPGYYKGKTYNNAYKRTLFRKSKVYYYSLQNQNPLPINDSVKIKRLNYIVHHKRNYDYLDFKLFFKRYKHVSETNALQLLGKVKFTKWNCSKVKLEDRNSIRTKHPIILGMMGSTIYHLGLGLLKSVKYKELFYLRQGIFTSLYCALVFGKVFWYRLSR